MRLPGVFTIGEVANELIRNLKVLNYEDKILGGLYLKGWKGNQVITKEEMTVPHAYEAYAQGVEDRLLRRNLPLQ